MKTNRSLKVRIAPALLITIIFGLVAVITTTYSIIQTRYSTSGVDVAKNMTVEYNTTGQQVGTLSISPSSGAFYYGLCQLIGNADQEYKVQYKLTTTSTWTVCRSDIHFPQNNVWQGKYFGFNADSTKKYNFQVYRTCCAGAYSKVSCDLWLE